MSANLSLCILGMLARCLSIAVFAFVPIASAVQIPDPLRKALSSFATSEACQKMFRRVDKVVSAFLDEPATSCWHDPETEAVRNTYNAPLHPTTVHMEFLEDSSKQRQSIIVVGPEGSGTTFVKHILKTRLQVPEWEFFDDYGVPNVKDAVIFHISQPTGFPYFRPLDGRDPLIMDSISLGSRVENGTIRTLLNNIDVLYSDKIRSYLNISSTIAEYRRHGEAVRILQVARDPRASLASKLKKNIIGNGWKSPVGEQHLAFKLMMEVKDMPEVTTICYEQMIQANGTAYVSEKLSDFGIKKEDVPKVLDGNAKYALDESQVCLEDDLAYMQLCPDSPLTAQLQQVCG